jgi:hypothetical protein
MLREAQENSGGSAEERRLFAALAALIDSGDESDAGFDRHARALFAYQHAHNEPYRRFCTARGITPDRITHWSQIPAAPAAAFKAFDLTCTPPEHAARIFRSSGTTGRASQPPLPFRRGARFVRSLAARGLRPFRDPGRRAPPHLGAGALSRSRTRVVAFAYAGLAHGAGSRSGPPLLLGRAWSRHSGACLGAHRCSRAPGPLRHRLRVAPLLRRARRSLRPAGWNARP